MELHQDVASLVQAAGMSEERASGILSRNVDPYTVIRRTKPGGGAREIHRPDDDILSLQRLLLKQLQKVHTPHPQAFAYVQGRSILDCARQHLDAAIAVRLDVRDFFHSVGERLIYRALLDGRDDRWFSVQVARLTTKPSISDLSWRQRRSGFLVESKCSTPGCNCGVSMRERRNYLGRAPEGNLPQGAPTSGLLSNLAFRHADQALYAWAAVNGFVYTRYSDDMYFSSRKQQTYDAVRDLISSTHTEVAKLGMGLNEKKTSVSRSGARRQVLGVLVDGAAPRLRSEYKRRVDAHIRGAERFGWAEHSAHCSFADVAALKSHVDGLISHAVHIEPIWGKDRESRWNAIA